MALLLGSPLGSKGSFSSLRALAIAACAAIGLTASAPPARADAIDDMAKKLIAYEGEVQQLKQTIRKPQISKGEESQASRRLVDAQVAFGIGDYDDAAVMLYDFVAKYPNNRSYDEALYYLAESLFRKRDLLASRTYFIRLIKELGSRSKFYQQGLERLIELSLLLHDDSDVKDWLAALDRVPESKRRASVYYVRGKYAYFNGNYDEAIRLFARLTLKSEYYFQARYFLAVSQVSKGNLLAAIRVYDKLLATKPRNDDDKYIIELTHLAMGRLFYECATAQQCGVALSERERSNIRKRYERAELTNKQLAEKMDEARQDKLWSKAIDQYLMISRHSKFFDEALYEIAWVYVKNKQFEKALRAVELMSLADPDSARLPDVKILEGQLRTRKGKRLAHSNEGNAAEEYSKAYEVFDRTRNTFRRPHDELKRLIEESVDPRQYMAQITGRNSTVFEVQSTMPDVAANWVRKQPEVSRVVAIETDLGDVEEEIQATERTITRLEQALSETEGVNIFPALSQKRTRAIEILEDLLRMRVRLADELRKRVWSQANASERQAIDLRTAARKQLTEEFAGLPDASLAYGERIERARSEYDALDKRASEVAVVIDSTQAVLVALEKYVADNRARGSLPKNVAEIESSIRELRVEVDAMRNELANVRHEATLAKDEAGTGDEVANRARALRTELRQAVSDELRAMQQVVPKLGGGSRAKADQILSLAQKASSITLQLDQTNKVIGEVVDMVLAEVRESVDEEKARLAAYKQEFNEYQNESRVIGGEVLGESFKAVAKEFYEILVQSDVGIIDITWAQREFADETAKRLNYDRKRALRTLDADFGDVLEQERKANKAKATGGAGEDDGAGEDGDGGSAGEDGDGGSAGEDGGAASSGSEGGAP